MIKLPSLKRRKPIVYISLGMYLLLTAFIIVESFLPSGISGLQSQFFALFGSDIVNTISGPVIPNEINPSSFEMTEDTTYLGVNEDEEALIAIGTTSRITFVGEYPKKENDYDVYNNKYVLEGVEGNNDDYITLVYTTFSNNKFSIVLRITANEQHSDKYQLNIVLADTFTFEYVFHIVDRAEPVNKFEASLEKNTLKIGETASIKTKLVDEGRKDTYLRRYLDVAKINRSSSNESVATIDEYGVIHGVGEGSATITFGTYNFDITVNDENIVKPINNHLDLTISDIANNDLSLLDYDYVFEDGANANDYSVLIYAGFENSDLEDKSVSWAISDELMGKVAPFKYDEEGFPIYRDDDGKECIRLCGYRKKGTVTVNCVSNADPSLTSSIDIDVTEAIPTSMNISISPSQSIYVNGQLTVSALFEPQNVNNKNIHAEANNDVVTIINNDSTSITIKGAKVGTSHIVVKSLANDTLVKEFDVTVSAKDVINKENYQEFHQLVRKFIGHFSLFLVDAIFGFIFFYTYLKDKKKWWIALICSLLAGFIVAGLSELIQYFIPTRGGVMEDVGIDFLGYFVGTILTFGVILLINLIRKKTKKEKVEKENS